MKRTVIALTAFVVVAVFDEAQNKTLQGEQFIVEHKEDGKVVSALP